MKTKTLLSLIIIFFFIFPIFSVSQNTWVQKTSLSGTARQYASSFSIGTKAYIVTGIQVPSNNLSDLWEYDQVTNAWAQRANFPGTARYGAAAFVIGNKGNVGTGYNSGVRYSDFYEYD